MWTGEVEMNVWMRPRLAGLMASPARSTSFCPARARPHMTAFLARLAISWTAAKSPSEATGNPASMMSTPMASSSSATSSFSSCVMVAPGDCSPSRKVVSKMTTRSFSDGAGVVMEWVLLVVRARLKALVRRSSGSVVPVNPLSAQAHRPSRPSGADKEQEPAANEGSAGRSLVGPPVGHADTASRRHRFRPTDGTKSQQAYH